MLKRFYELLLCLVKTCLPCVLSRHTEVDSKFPVYFALRIINNSFALNNMAPSVLPGQAFSLMFGWLILIQKF